MNQRTRAQLQIHVCVVLWGFTAILGKLITLAALPLVWWRMLIVVAVLALLPRVWHELRAMPWRLRFAYAGIGAIVALHWLTFYGAVKLANASVAATCMALATVFTALVEPLVTRSRFSRAELALGITVLPGVALVTGGVPQEMRAGIVVGAVSALLVAFFGSLNKRLVTHGEPLTMTAIELASGAVVMTLLAGAMPYLFAPLAGPLLALPAPGDALLLLVLALACTLLPFALSLVALRHMSAFSAQLAVNLEPIYAIVLAALLLNEQRELTPLFYVGVLIILTVVFAHPLVAAKRAAAQQPEHPELLGTAEAKQVIN